MKSGFNRLTGRIIERYGSQRAFAEAVGLSERSLSLKLRGRVEFRSSEIERWCETLGIAPEDIPKYFFPSMKGKR